VRVEVASSEHAGTLTGYPQPRLTGGSTCRNRERSAVRAQERAAADHEEDRRGADPLRFEHAIHLVPGAEICPRYHSMKARGVVSMTPQGPGW
jgi:hypothetical protein